MLILDANIVAVALPILSQAFQVDASTVLWVGLAYLLVATGLLLAWGQLGDAWGRKRVYITGFLVFTLGLGLCSLARGIPELLLYRVIQAAGGAMTMAMGYAIVTSAFPSQERGKAIGRLGTAVGVGLTLGPPLGGFLLDRFDW